MRGRSLESLVPQPKTGKAEKREAPSTTFEISGPPVCIYEWSIVFGGFLSLERVGEVVEELTYDDDVAAWLLAHRLRRNGRQRDGAEIDPAVA